LLNVGVGVSKLVGAMKFGVMVGTGVSRLYAMAVDRNAMFSAAGSLSSKISLMIARFAFRKRKTSSSAL
jgi:hypothetical protein